MLLRLRSVPIAVKASIFGSSVLLVALVLGIAPLTVIVGPERYAGQWGLAEQLAYVQLVGALLTVALAGGFGWYAFEQLAEARRVRKEQRSEEIRRLIDALAVLSASLEHNQERFENLRTLVERGGGVLEPNLHAAAWDAVRPDVVPLLHVPALAADLAQHFAAVAAVARTLETYSDLIVRVPGYSASEAAEMQKIYLLRRMESLQDETGLLALQIEQRSAERQSEQFAVVPA